MSSKIGFTKNNQYKGMQGKMLDLLLAVLFLQADNKKHPPAENPPTE